MFIPMPFCVAIVVVAMVGVLVIVAGVYAIRYVITIAENWRTIHHVAKAEAKERLREEESARHRVIHLLITVHQARHPNWKIEYSIRTGLWQGLADGLLRMLPKDADILTVLDGAFPHEERIELTEPKGTET
ncbi:MAG: hypothetical protein GY832_25085 [Chloroflexi bacterium]|nr:hypothetical protein [Chloroflexota bacterium]